MGAHLRELKLIARHPELRQYVETILIQDDKSKIDLENPFVAVPFWNIWPEGEDQQILADQIGVKDLQAILNAGKLKPKKIIVRDYQFDPWDERAPFRRIPSYLNPNAASSVISLAHAVLRHADVTIYSLDHDHKKPASPRDASLRWTHEVVIEVLPEHQNRKARYSLLQSAEIMNLHSDWLNEALYQAPNLKDLVIKGGHEVPDLISDIPDAVCELQCLHLSRTTVTMKVLLAILANSKTSLTKLVLESVRLKGGKRWGKALATISRKFPNLSEFYMTHLVDDSVMMEISDHRRRGLYVDFQGFLDDPFADEAESDLKLGGMKINYLRGQQFMSSIAYKGECGSKILGRIAQYAHIHFGSDCEGCSHEELSI